MRESAEVWCCCSLFALGVPLRPALSRLPSVQGLQTERRHSYHTWIPHKAQSTRWYIARLLAYRCAPALRP